MKKLIFTVLAGLALASCGSLPPPADKFYYTSYQPLTAEGIYATSSPSVPFEYESLGVFMLVSESGFVSIDTDDSHEDKRRIIEDMYVTPRDRDKDAEYKPTDNEHALKAVSDYLHLIEANGIINLRVQFIRLLNTDAVDKIIVTGEAIKKK